MKTLSANILNEISNTTKLSKPTDNLLALPEKVLQFGTGVLLRGLPDYYIDKANKQGIFNGRVVVVKSTDRGDANAFDAQDGLYTHVIRGVQQGSKVEEDIINASVSRVVSAASQWADVLAVAESEDLEIVISNTTEVGIQLEKGDNIFEGTPHSFPGKLLAVLYHRYKIFNGDENKGLVIVPTELIVDNANKLKAIVLELAQLNNLDEAFVKWIDEANYFCNSLVDRIVPGKLPQALKDELVNEYGYNDDLMVMSESYSLWAIQVNDKVAASKLSFAAADSGIVMAPDIEKFRELKLRLLNGTHTLTCGLAFLAGFTTVKDAMEDETMSSFIKQLMLDEIAPAIVNDGLSNSEAETFAGEVLDRFRNPHIEHQWLSITLQYSGKMKMRVLPVLLKHYDKSFDPPQHIALGFAAYIAFMNNKAEAGNTGLLNGKTYQVQDERAGWFSHTFSTLEGADLVKAVLSDVAFWEVNLEKLPGFSEAVASKFTAIQQGRLQSLLQQVTGLAS